MSRRLLVIVTAAVLALGAGIAGQISTDYGGGTGAPRTMTRQVPVGTGVLSGTVLAADTGQPVRYAQVTIAGQADPPPAMGGATDNSGPTAARGAARMTVAGGGLMVSQASMADPNGQFSFDHLPPGDFRIRATHEGFISTGYGAPKPGRPGTLMPLGPGQHASIMIPLVRGGVITGIVIGDDGQPAARAQVSAMRYGKSQGVTQLQGTGSMQSDDRGTYRLSGLQPGDYVISATPSGQDVMQADRIEADHDRLAQAIAAAGPGAKNSPYYVVTITQPLGGVGGSGPPNSSYLPTYSPSATSPVAATIITRGPGEERSGVDVRTLLIRGTDVTGSIANAPPAPVRVQLSVFNDDPAAPRNYSFIGPDPDGTFRVRNLAPGQYTLFAQTTPAPQPQMVAQMLGNLGIAAPAATLIEIPRLWGEATVTVDGQSSPTAAIALQPGKSISGQVLFDMARPPDLTRAHIMVTLSQAAGQPMPQMGQPPQVQVGADGHFTLTDVFPGRYEIRANAGGFAKSSMVNGVDTLDFPFAFDASADVTGVVITVTDRPAELSGTLTDAAGKAIVNDTIVLAPDDTRFWTPNSRRLRTAQPDAAGHFAFTGLAAGDYWIAAVADLDQGSQYDPDVLKTLAAAAVHVSVGEGAQAQQNVRLAQ